MVKHRLSEPGEERRFDFKMGDSVCTVHGDGTPNLEKSGIIVDGVWEGTGNEGGAYTAIYTVKEGEGKFFDAKHNRLMSVPVR
jgi:hypothetical protein